MDYGIFGVYIQVPLFRETTLYSCQDSKAGKATNTSWGNRQRGQLSLVKGRDTCPLGFRI